MKLLKIYIQIKINCKEVFLTHIFFQNFGALNCLIFYVLRIGIQKKGGRWKPKYNIHFFYCQAIFKIPLKNRFSEIRNSKKLDARGGLMYAFITDDMVGPSLRFFENYIHFTIPVGNWSQTQNIDFVNILNTRDQGIYRFFSYGMAHIQNWLLVTISFITLRIKRLIRFNKINSR